MRNTARKKGTRMLASQYKTSPTTAVAIMSSDTAIISDELGTWAATRSKLGTLLFITGDIGLCNDFNFSFILSANLSIPCIISMLA